MKLVFENFTPVKIVKGQCISSHLFLFTSAAHFTAASRNAKLSTPDWLRFVAAVLLCGSSFFWLFLKGRRFCGKIATDT